MQNHPMYGTVLHLLYTYKGGLFFMSMNPDKRRHLKCLIFFMRWEFLQPAFRDMHTGNYLVTVMIKIKAILVH